MSPNSVLIHVAPMDDDNAVYKFNVATDMSLHHRDGSFHLYSNKPYIRDDRDSDLLEAVIKDLLVDDFAVSTLWVHKFEILIACNSTVTIEELWRRIQSTVTEAGFVLK